MSEKNYTQLREKLSYRRRSILTSIGAGAGLAALGGHGVYAAEDHDDGDDDGTAGEETADGERGVRPTFGYAAESTDVDPPVDPDHEVALVEAERERGDIPLPAWYFDPVGLYVEPGETVRFTLESPFHTITAYHPDLGFTQRVPDEVGPISSPILWTDAYFLYTFEEPGVYDLQCLPHGWTGMVIRVVVGEASGPGAEEVPEAQNADPIPDPADLSPPEMTAASVFRDPTMDPETIIDRGSVTWDDLDPESKELSLDMLMPEDHDSLAAVLSETEDGPSSDGSGCAHFTVTETGLEFDLVLENIEGVTQAHVHEGDSSEDGPIVAPLFEFTAGVDGTGEGEPRDAESDSPLIETGTIDDVDVEEEILSDPSGYYVNVHTTENPSGEIRGQIRRHDLAQEDEMQDDDGPGDGGPGDDEAGDDGPGDDGPGDGGPGDDEAGDDGPGDDGPGDDGPGDDGVGADIDL